MTDEELEDKMWGVKYMPQFKGKKAYVLGGAFFGSCVELMAEAGFERAGSVEEADVVVFIGGVDINPALYSQQPIQQTQTPSKVRDMFEQEVFNKCVEQKKVMFGICRGAQLLHALNGGELWQHVEGHAGPDHLIYDIEEDVFIDATSLHHQMLALNADIDVIAVTKDQVSSVFHSADMIVDLGREGANSDVEIEIEAGSYLMTRCFFVQGHPEIGSAEYRTWTMTKLKEFMEEVAEIDEGVEASREEEEAAQVVTEMDLWRTLGRALNP